MTSPDIPVWVPTVVHTVDEQDLVAAAIADIRTAVPDWVPREGHTEVMLIEAMAVIAGQTVYAANQLPSVVLEGLLTLYGVARKPAAPAQGQVRITAATGVPAPRSLPAGTRMRIDTGDGDTLDVVTVDQVTVDPAVSLTAIVAVVAAEAGSRPNGIVAGTALQLVDPAAWLETVVLATALSGGVAVEDTAAFLARGAGFLRRQSSTLVLAPHFTAAALDVDGVGRAYTIDLWNPTSGNAPGADPGHVTVVIADAQGHAVATAVKTATQAALTGSSVAGLGIHLINPTSVTVNVTAQVIVADGYTPSVVLAAVQADLRTWLDPATWPWGRSLSSSNQVIARMSRVPGVSWVKTVTAATTFTDPKVLPTAGTLAITQGTP